MKSRDGVPRPDGFHPDARPSGVRIPVIADGIHDNAVPGAPLAGGRLLGRVNRYGIRVNTPGRYTGLGFVTAIPAFMYFTPRLMPCHLRRKSLFST